MEKQCHICNNELKLVPAGYSKTKKDRQGRPKAYDAFWACPNKCAQPYQSPTPVVRPYVAPKPAGIAPNLANNSQLDRIENKLNQLLAYNGLSEKDMPAKGEIKPKDLPF